MDAQAPRTLGTIVYQFGSQMTGWSTNDNMYATATALSGPWGEWHPFAPLGTNTFDSQVSVVLPIETAEGPRHIYFGDRWQKHDLLNSPPIWLPIVISNGTAALLWVDEWAPFDPAH